MSARTDNEILHRGWLAAAGLLLTALLLPATAAAADAVGRVLSVRGDVTAVRDGESRRSLSRGDEIFEGDEITTGPNGRTQIRFIDEGLTNLSPATTFAVDEYRLEPEDENGGGSVVMSFLRGAMRTVTGLIGDREQDTYRMNTPTATIGVRGTGYALQYCDAACAQEFGGQPGLYGRVDEGTIRVDTPRGSLDFRSGAYFFVPQGGVPQGILQPPSGVLDGEEDEGNGDGGDTGEGVAIIPVEDEDEDLFLTEDELAESDFEAGDETLADFSIDTIAAGVAGGFNSGGRTLLSDTELFGAGEEGSYDTDPQGRIIAAELLSGDSSVQVASAQLLDVGTLDDLGVGWGRWEGDFLVNGSPATGNLAFTVSDNLTDPEFLGSLTGSFDYNLAGGPSAFEPNGDLWAIEALSLNVEFSLTKTPVTLNTFELTDSQQTISFDSADSGTSTLEVTNNVLTLNGSNGIESFALEGQFVGVEAGGLIVVFSVSEVEGTLSITGTSILAK